MYIEVAGIIERLLKTFGHGRVAGIGSLGRSSAQGLSKSSRIDVDIFDIVSGGIGSRVAGGGRIVDSESIHVIVQAGSGTGSSGHGRGGRERFLICGDSELIGDLHSEDWVCSEG